MPRGRRNEEPPPSWINNKDDDLHIPDATPKDVARALMQGGAKPRPETRITKSKKEQSVRSCTLLVTK